MVTSQLYLLSWSFIAVPANYLTQHAVSTLIVISQQKINHGVYTTLAVLGAGRGTHVKNKENRGSGLSIPEADQRQVQNAHYAVFNKCQHWVWVIPPLGMEALCEQLSLPGSSCLFSSSFWSSCSHLSKRTTLHTAGVKSPQGIISPVVQSVLIHFHVFHCFGLSPTRWMQKETMTPRLKGFWGWSHQYWVDCRAFLLDM